LNVGESEEGKDLTRREIRTSPLVCLEDACRETGKARNMRSSGTRSARSQPSPTGKLYGRCRPLPGKAAINGALSGSFVDFMGRPVPKMTTEYPITCIMVSCRLRPSNFGRYRPFPGTSLELRKAVQVPIFPAIRTRYGPDTVPTVLTLTYCTKYLIYQILVTLVKLV
jgi:hypothetical protein